MLLNILTLYYSESGMTKIIADTINEASKKWGKSELKQINSNLNINMSDYDILFIGSPCHSRNLAPEVLGFLSKAEGVPKIGAASFVTHAADKTWKHDYDLCEPSFVNFTNNKKIRNLGFFSCMAKLSPSIRDMIGKYKGIPKDEWDRMNEEMDKHPDENDIKNASSYIDHIFETIKSETTVSSRS